MIKWLNDILGISNEVSVPTLISIIVFVLGGTINFLFNQFNAMHKRKVHRKTFLMLIKYIITDIKIKERNVENLKNQIELTYEEGWTYTQKTISYLDTIFEFDFEEMFYSFDKKFFWDSSKNVKYKAFHKIWEILRELKFFETQISVHLDDFTKGFDERHVKYNESMAISRDYIVQQANNVQFEKYLKDNPILLKYLEEEKNIWLAWNDLGEMRSHYYYSYNHLVRPLLLLNRKYPHLSITIDYTRSLLDCETAYYEIKNAVETYKGIFTTYHQFYKNRNRLLKKCLDIIHN